MYAELDSDACKEKQNITQDNYFDSLMHLRNVVWSETERLLSQKVVLFHNNARLHKAQLIPTVLKDFCCKQFEHPPYALNFALSDYHLFPWLKKN